MKGIIAVCLKEMVIEKFGIDKWGDLLIRAGETRDISFLATGDVEDRDIMTLIRAASEVLNMSMRELADVFGEYWINSFSQKVYSSLYRRYKTAEEFILAIDSVHLDATRKIRNASPPRFDYVWKDTKTLLMTYTSRRNMIDFVAGLIRGVGKYYQEDLQVTKIDDNTLEVIFGDRSKGMPYPYEET